MKQTTQTYLSLPETFHPASTTSGKQPDSSLPRCYSDGRPYYSLNAWLEYQWDTSDRKDRFPRRSKEN